MADQQEFLIGGIAFTLTQDHYRNTFKIMCDNPSWDDEKVQYIVAALIRELETKGTLHFTNSNDFQTKEIQFREDLKVVDYDDAVAALTKLEKQIPNRDTLRDFMQLHRLESDQRHTQKTNKRLEKEMQPYAKVVIAFILDEFNLELHAGEKANLMSALKAIHEEQKFNDSPIEKNPSPYADVIGTYIYEELGRELDNGQKAKMVKSLRNVMAQAQSK